MSLDEQLERAIVGAFVDGFDRRARAIRAEVGAPQGGDAVLRLRAAADLEACAASVATLLPPDAPGASSTIVERLSPPA